MPKVESGSAAPPKPRTEFSHETADEIVFNYVCECEDCDGEGELGLLKSEGMTPFGCPEGCGATYVPWKFGSKWKLKCVVLPHYGRERGTDASS